MINYQYSSYITYINNDVVVKLKIELLKQILTPSLEGHFKFSFRRGRVGQNRVSFHLQVNEIETENIKIV